MNPTELREQGNQAFKQGRFQEAIDRYTDALAALNDAPSSENTKTELTKCYSNRSQCHISLGQYPEAIDDATRGKNVRRRDSRPLTFVTSALECTPSDQKSLYRRANAFERIGKISEAISDAQRLMTLTSKSGPSDEQTNVLLRKLRESAMEKVMRYFSFSTSMNDHRSFSLPSISIRNRIN